jgi:hypothetical protein
MRRILWAVTVAATSMALLGCGDNRLVGNRLTPREDRWFGELGVMGNLNELRVLSGSDLTYLKIVGDANKVYVEDDVTLGKVEIWGENNEVSVPDYLRVRESVVGNGSRVIRRATGWPQRRAPQATEPTEFTPAQPDDESGTWGGG